MSKKTKPKKHKIFELKIATLGSEEVKEEPKNKSKIKFFAPKKAAPKKCASKKN